MVIYIDSSNTDILMNEKSAFYVPTFWALSHLQYLTSKTYGYNTALQDSPQFVYFRKVLPTALS